VINTRRHTPNALGTKHIAEIGSKEFGESDHGGPGRS